ncbi:uncharacterized protein LOC123300724 isoform X2 [Chrysoperla carnea]|uniref:uncharacterized protein LOC123300724 isoform X2 n=1 Tax=Chrysoperla carnea TaxID=189513 RepID=UPI001D05FAE7|nr:uncharacterized protein LOC123300724 isoform X2 [Chrysoperla carnea]
MEFWCLTLRLIVFCSVVTYSLQVPYDDGKQSIQTAKLFEILMHSNYSRINHQRSQPNLGQTDALIIPNPNPDKTHIQKIPRKNSKSFKDDQNEQSEETEARIDSTNRPVRGHFITYIPKVTSPIPPFQKPKQFDSDEQVIEDIPDQFSQDTEDQPYQLSIPDQETQQVDSYQQSIPDQEPQQVDSYQQSIPDQETQQVDSYQQSIPDQETQQVDSYQQSIPDQETQQVDEYQQTIPDQETQQSNFYQQNRPDQDVEQIEDLLSQRNVPDQDTQQFDDSPYQQNIPDQNVEELEYQQSLLGQDLYQKHVPKQNHYQESIPDQTIQDHNYNQQSFQDQWIHNTHPRQPEKVLRPPKIPSLNNQHQNPIQSRPINVQSESTNDNVRYFGQSFSDQNLHPASDRNVQYFGIPTSSHPINSQNSYGFQQSQNNQQISGTTNNQHYGYLECPSGATGMFPYALDCKQFLNCWNGRGSIQNCAPGTVFNPQTVGCDFPEKVNCSAYKSQANFFDTEKYPNSYLGKNRNTKSVNDNIADGSNKYQTRSQFVTNRIQQDVVVFCPENFVGIKAHPTDCSKYINCDKGGSTIEECILGMKFNSKTGQCDFPKFVDCNSRKSQQLINVNPSTPVDLSSRLSNRDPECPPGLSGLIAHPYNCELFLNCGSGRTFIQKCGPGTVFNPNILACDYPQNVDCKHTSDLIVNPSTTSKPYPIPTVKPKPYPKPNPNPTQKPFPDPQIDIRMQPHNYYTTNTRSGKYVQNQQNTQLNQYNQNGWHDKTQELSSATSYTDTRPQCPTGFSGLIPHPTKCDSFLNCANGRTVVQKCGPGTVYNAKILGCDFPQNVNCQQSATIIQPNVDPSIDIRTAPKTQKHYDGFQSGKYEENRWVGLNTNQQHENVQSNWKSQENSRTRSTFTTYQAPLGGVSQSQNNVQCPNDFSGLISHPTECASYLNCNNGDTVVQKCGPGTVFNPSIKACDFPHNVNCQQIRTLTQSSGDRNLDFQTVSQTNQNEYSNSNQFHGHDQHHKHGSWNQNGFQHSEQFHRDHPQGTAWRRVGHAHGHHHHHNGSSGPWIGYHNLRNHPTPTPAATYESTPTLDTATLGSDSRQAKEREELDLWYKFVNKPNSKDLDGAPTNSHGYSTVSTQGAVKGGEKRTVSTTDSYVTSYVQHNTPLQTFSQVKPTPEPPKKNSCFPHKFECSPDMCLNLAFVCDGIKHCPNGADEENCKNTMEKVVSHKGKRLMRHDVQRWFSVTLNKCAQYCESSKTFECKSFNYRASDGECILSDEVVGQTGDMQDSYQYDFYEMKKFSVNCDMKYTCDNFKCIELHEACNGVDNCGDNSDEKYCDKHASEFGVRLVGSKNMNEGRLEVKAFGRWGTVCDDKFSLKNAEVACRELGYPLGAVQVLHNPLYFAETNNVQNPNNTLILMDDVDCLGNETSLKDCEFNGWGVHNCKADEVVGIVCKTSTVTCPKDYWLCAGSMECIPLAFLCDHVDDCIDKSDESPSYCEAETELRLANGSTPLEGRVEIRFYGVWGTICDDDFTDEAATVICNQMGYFGPARVKKGGMYGPGSGPIWLDQVSCFGNETSVEKCLHNERGQHNCEHSEDVGVVCSRGYESGIKNGYRGINKPTIPRSVVHTNSIDLDDVLPTTCGVRDEETFLPDSVLSFRVVAGSVAKKGHYPWQASLRVKGQSKTSHWCGGVIITRLHVLTAAHCLVGFSKGIYVIRAGDYESEVDEGTEQEAYIEEFYLHESFRKEHHMNNDIAIIKLKGEGFHLEKHVQAICLPNEDTDYVPGKNCTISGWGSTQSGKLSAALQLRAGWIPIQSREVCSQPEVYGENIKEGMFCAGSLDQGVDSCDGDSGGPLACLDNGYFTLFGITSWGQHCGYANKPGVYVKIGHYRKWIDETILKSLK